MEITEVRCKLMEDPDDRLRAFCSITFDNCFVVRDLKIIDGASGPFVAMPSRKLTFHCGKCGGKNHLRANFCNQCGGRLREQQGRDTEGRTKLYADIAHPINAECREVIQNRVIEEFMAELERSGQPGYVSRYDEDYDEDYEPDYEEGLAEDRRLRADAAQAPAGPHAAEPAGEAAPAERTEPRKQLPEKEPGESPPSQSSFGAGLFDNEEEL
ncbi:MAG: SpoVG family protein [Planctomycetes bacterium]|nr:SpoVG family protein [Planctomycetota bacterium]